MRLNRNGFVLEGAAAYILVSLAAVAVVLLTPVKDLLNIPGENGQKTVQQDSYKETMVPYTENGQPVKVKLSDGTEALLFKRVVQKNSMDEQTQPKKTLWQKIKQYGLWWLVISIFAAVTGRLGFVNMINNKAKDVILDEFNRLKNDAKKVVLSVDESLTVVDSRIAAANAAVDSARTAAASVSDPTQLAGLTRIIEQQQAVAAALVDTKTAILAAMSKKQDQSTKLMVSQLRNA